MNISAFKNKNTAQKCAIIGGPAKVLPTPEPTTFDAFNVAKMELTK